MKKKVEKVIGEIRPMLQADGGDVELVAVEGNTIKVKLTGACAGCPMSQITLQQGIERILKENIPGIDRVEAVTD